MLARIQLKCLILNGEKKVSFRTWLCCDKDWRQCTQPLIATGKNESIVWFFQFNSIDHTVCFLPISQLDIQLYSKLQSTFPVQIPNTEIALHLYLSLATFYLIYWHNAFFRSHIPFFFYFELFFFKSGTIRVQLMRSKGTSIVIIFM